MLISAELFARLASAMAWVLTYADFNGGVGAGEILVTWAAALAMANAMPLVKRTAMVRARARHLPLTELSLSWPGHQPRHRAITAALLPHSCELQSDAFWGAAGTSASQAADGEDSAQPHSMRDGPAPRSDRGASAIPSRSPACLASWPNIVRLTLRDLWLAGITRRSAMRISGN